MTIYDFSAPRLYVEPALSTGVALALDKSQQNYLHNVLRLSEGESVLIFNGRDGEWLSRLVSDGRRRLSLMPIECIRSQTGGGDLHYLFAPLKHARLDYMIQKAVEMGATCLRPVITRRTQASRVNAARMRANVIEAAEQCGIIALPEVRDVVPLAVALNDWPAERRLIFCDEETEAADSVTSLRAAAGNGPLAVLIGPEGGFDPAEREDILAMPATVRVSLGPRILRADTAAVAALALVQAVVGDWRPKDM
jgi:16S rRNA (uracil1498-N3)-methyltransferase